MSLNHAVTGLYTQYLMSENNSKGVAGFEHKEVISILGNALGAAEANEALAHEQYEKLCKIAKVLDKAQIKLIDLHQEEALPAPEKPMSSAPQHRR